MANSDWHNNRASGSSPQGPERPLVGESLRGDVLESVGRRLAEARRWGDHYESTGSKIRAQYYYGIAAGLTDLLTDWSGQLTERESDTPQGDVEERSGESRGVGEIAGAGELLDIIDSRIDEARERAMRYDKEGRHYAGNYFDGQEAALVTLRTTVVRLFSERGGLPNACQQQPAPGQNDE